MDKKTRYSANTNRGLSRQPTRLALLLTTVLSVGACTDPGATAGCGVELESARLAAALVSKPDRDTALMVHLRLLNESKLPTQVKTLLWILEVDGQALSRGRSPINKPLKASASEAVQLNIPLSELAAQFVAAAMNKPHRQVRLMGFCQIEIAGSSRELAFDAKQEVY